jgi:hypothetical protein
MNSWIWIVAAAATAAIMVVLLIKTISIRKYKRHIAFLKREMRNGRNELHKVSGEKIHLEKEMTVIKNIYRNKLLTLTENEAKKEKTIF